MILFFKISNSAWSVRSRSVLLLSATTGMKYLLRFTRSSKGQSPSININCNIWVVNIAKNCILYLIYLTDLLIVKTPNIPPLVPIFHLIALVATNYLKDILLIYRDSRTDVNEEELWKTNITEINNCVDLAAKSLGNYYHNICLTSLTRAKPKEKMEFPA